MAGIDSLISNRVDAFANNPQALMQRYSMSQDLLDLLALQKLKQEKEAVARTLQMQMQAPQGTVKDQLEGQVMDMTRREVAQAAAPGLQQQGQRMVANQMQEAMGAGLPTQPAPALQGMAQGGIVGYAPGGRVESGLTEEYLASLTPEERRRVLERAALERFDQRRAAERAVAEAEAAARDNAAVAADPMSGINALRSLILTRNMPSTPTDIASVQSEGTPTRDIPISMDALRRFDERRKAGAEAGIAAIPTGMGQTQDDIAALTELTSGPQGPLRRGAEAGIAAIPTGMGQTQDDIAALTELTSGPQGPLRRGAEVGIAAIPSRMGQTQDDIAALTELTSGPQGPLNRTPTTAPARTPTAPTATVPEETVSGVTKQASDVAGLSGMRKETALPQEEADTPQAERPQFRSRYEDRLAEIEAEKQDKLGALIEFLQAAGASRGTNLGATLTGGGSGLRARDERLRQQETEALKSAVEEENAYLQRMFNEEQLRQQADIARQNREMQERVSEADRIAEAKRATLSAETQLEVARLQNPAERSTDEQRQINAYVKYFKTQEPSLSDVDAAYLAYQQVAAENIAATTARVGAQQQLSPADAINIARQVVANNPRNLGRSETELAQQIQEVATQLLTGATNAQSTEPAGISAPSNQNRPPLSSFMTSGN